MNRTFSTREAALRLGVSLNTLQRHVAGGTVDAPPLAKVGGIAVRLWSSGDITRARRKLAKVKTGRKRKQG